MKKLRLNTLFIICLSSFVILTFIVLSLVAVTNLEKAKKLTEQNSIANITLLTDSVFTEDVKAFSSTINMAFEEYLSIAKLISVNVENLENISLPKTDLKLTYDRETDIFKYIDLNLDDLNGEMGGFYALYYSGNNKAPNKVIQSDIERLHALKPFFKEICMQKPDIVNLSIFNSKYYMVSYAREPSLNLNINNDKSTFSGGIDKFYSTKLKVNKPLFILEKNVKHLNMTLICIVYPIGDLDGKINDLVIIFLDYKSIISKFNSIFSLYLQKHFEPLVMILDDGGHIAYLSRKKYKFLSLPFNNIGNSGHDVNDDLIIKTKLNSSKDPNIRAMGNKFFESNSGKFRILINNEYYIAIFETIHVNGWKTAILLKESKLYNKLDKSEKEFNLIFSDIYKNYFIYFIILLIIGIAVSCIVFRKLFIAPIERLRTDTKKLGRGDFEVKVTENGIREISELSNTFNNLGSELKKYTENLKNEIKTRQAIETEIQLAKRIQQTTLPDPSEFPTYGKFILTAKLNPAQDISGDFYDFFYLDDDNIAVIIADVSGKGLQAAFFMAMSKALIKNYSLADIKNPDKVLEKVNKALCLDNKLQMFVTVFLVYYNLKDGSTKYAVAGHNTALKISNTKEVSWGKSANNIALGIYDEAKYNLFTGVSSPGNVFILFTDGVPEAISSTGEEYGLNRLKSLVLDNTDKSPDDLADIIMDNVLTFEEKSRFDDITLIVFKRLK